MHPLSTALFLLGYALAIPITGKLGAIAARQHRLAMWGHQFGILLATLGWVLRGQLLVAFAHAVWLTGVYMWFEIKNPRRQIGRSIRRDGSTG